MEKMPVDVSNFRRLALALPDTVEMSHMGKADFRIQRGEVTRIFATLAYGEKGLGTLILKASQQAIFLAEAPEYFSQAPGGWGRMGVTLVRVDAPDEVLTGALATAHKYIAEKMKPKKKPMKRW